jgi:hypothetical protein
MGPIRTTRSEKYQANAYNVRRKEPAAKRDVIRQLAEQDTVQRYGSKFEPEMLNRTRITVSI